MGNYNPHAPLILGQEWVPIRDRDQIFSPSVNSLEVGHKFTLTGSTAINNARFYINELRPLSDRGQTFMAAIYPYGTEDQSGPIERCIIPCNAVILTNATVSSAPTAVEALATQSTSSGISLDCSQPDTGLALSFAVSSYPQLLGKRILGVNLKTGTAASPDITGPLRNTSTSIIKVSTTSTIGSTANPEALFGSLRIDQDIDTAKFGEINQFQPAGAPHTIPNRPPWTGSELTHFDAVATRFYTRIETGTNRGTTANSSCYIFYAALEVIYCEEQRLAYGAVQFGTSNASHSFGAESVLGANAITMYTVQTLATNPTLAAGDYLLTLSSADVGGLNDNQAQTTSDYPDLNAVLELYSIPSHPGVQLNLPFPVEDHIGDTFTSEQTHTLPQISLHNSSGTLTAPHVYGRQAAAQVYGGTTASQSINDDVSGVNASYPQVRYYARRFGDTTIPLTLAGVTALSLPGVGLSYASTPDNAALDIVGDIDLRFSGDINWRPPVPMTLISKWNESTNNRSYLFYVNSNGTLVLTWSTNGVAVDAATSTVPVPFINGSGAVVAQINVAGGGNHSVAFYVGLSIGGPFTQLGATVISAGVTSIFSGASEVEIGAHTAGQAPLTGLVYAAEIRNGLGGIAVANPDFTIQTPGVASFVDAAGRTWTMVGSAAIVGGNPASSASISVASFDELPEILDGWREVTLRFGTAPTMGAQAGFPRYTWSAAGESAGNRWEILAASAPAVSGIGTNLFNPVPAPNQLGVATYQPNAGEAVHLEWYPQGVASPFVAATATDYATDAVLIFSQDPPTITGVGLTARTQSVSGIGFDCGNLPCCIPSGIGYQQITWSSPPVSGSGLNALRLPGTAGNYASTPDNAALDITGDIDLRVDVAPNSWQTLQILIAKWNTTGNQRSYLLQLNGGFLQFVWSTNGTLEFEAHVALPPVQGRYAVRVTMDVNNGAGGNTATFYTAPTIAGPWTQLGSPVIGGATTSIFSGTAVLEVGSHSSGTASLFTGLVYAAEVRNGIDGTAVANPNFSAQAAGTPSFVDAAGRTWTMNGTAAIITPPTYVGMAGLELQRYDSVTGQFETIMLSTNAALTSFNDFEARVGITSVYRIRALNALNFAGAWSSQVSGAPPTPGITGGCADMTGALIFTSNADQTGASNAAYIMQWPNTPTEDFSLPEGDAVTYQPMYGRDGSVAFHGTERGLEVFSRTLLLNAAAIDPVRLADAATIRNLAWADLPYICVRDDIGDRWFASVRVPSVNARMNRTKYMARVDIVETTRTPYAVNP
jgi:hypothetical protein